MAAEGGVYLPPVISELLANADQFYKVYEDVKAYLVDFAKTVTHTQLGATDKRLITDVGNAEATVLKAWKNRVTQTQLGGWCRTG
jgi:hypothetical protein